MIIAVAARLNDNKKRYQVSSSLINRLIQKKILPLIVYPQSNLKEIVRLCDGLIISGGDDVHPRYYQEKLQDSMILEDESIEALDFQCLAAFVKANKPVLGICRGIQVIGAAYHVQMLNDVPHHQQVRHFLQLHPHSLFHNISASVNSFHHQCLQSVPQGFLLSAVSEDGCIEAIEKPNIFAVQWHPELEENDLVIPLFLEYVANKKISQ